MKTLVSTAWIRDDVKRLESILNYIDGIEINSIGNKQFSKEILSFSRKNGLEISSIHASAGPHKEQENAYYLPNIASPNTNLREYDVEQLILTAEWAAKIGIDKIVLHAGNIDDKNLKEMFINYKEQFIKKRNKESLNRLKSLIINKRKKLVAVYLESLVKSLSKVCSYIPEVNFYLETRLNYYEIPTPEEAKNIIKNLNYKNLGYWNDIGHSYIENELGFINFEKWKSELNKYCGGLHIHDINGKLKDHYPPGFGNAPILEMLKGFPQNIPWVLEINSRHTPEEIIKGINIYKNLIDLLFLH